jgi:hypothetical protein
VSWRSASNFLVFLFIFLRLLYLLYLIERDTPLSQCDVQAHRFVGAYLYHLATIVGACGGDLLPASAPVSPLV